MEQLRGKKGLKLFKACTFFFFFSPNALTIMTAITSEATTENGFVCVVAGYNFFLFVVPFHELIFKKYVWGSWSFFLRGCLCGIEARSSCSKIRLRPIVVTLLFCGFCSLVEAFVYVMVLCGCKNYGTSRAGKIKIIHFIILRILLDCNIFSFFLLFFFSVLCNFLP